MCKDGQFGRGSLSPLASHELRRWRTRQRREREFEALTEDEVKRLESIVNDAFDDFDDTGRTIAEEAPI